jgi:thiol-disulfide isomerase/thioredoxin
MKNIKTMQMQRTLFAIIFLFLFLLTSSCLEKADTHIPIKKMDLETLDKLMKSWKSPNLIAFTAAWCGPCKEELPLLNKLYVKYKKDGLKITGVALDLEGPSAMQPIVDRLKIDFPIYWVGEKAVNHYEIDALPMIFVINNGNIAERIPGKRSEKYLEEKVNSLLK